MRTSPLAAVLVAAAVLLPLSAPSPGHAAPAQAEAAAPAARLAALAQTYYDGYYALFPLDATENIGDERYEGQFAVDIAPAHRDAQRAFYRRTQAELARIDPKALTGEDRLTYAILEDEARRRLLVLDFPTHLVPMEQLNSIPTRLAQWGTGKGPQPLKTVANYEHYLARIDALPGWTDQAIANMREGLSRGITQSRPIMERVLTQMNDLLPADREKTLFLQPIHQFPDGVGAADRERLAAAYRKAAFEKVLPAIARLRDFLAEEYVPHCRTSAGIGALPGGEAWYRAMVLNSTTTTLTPDEIHALGLKEVQRILGEMEGVKKRMGFQGDLHAFFRDLKSRPELKPFHTEEEVLDAYRALNRRIEARLPQLFARAPKARLDIRAVEKLRQDTASDHYIPPAADGSRPGVFYTVIRDPRQYETMGMTSLFLHEGQPGHHYQMAIQQELPLPALRRFAWYDAYGEGWALYTEGLGRDLGLYDDPIPYMGRLFMELHRAIRLVVDTGLHAKGWSREQTIRYMMETEGSSEDTARRATERYMAWPGQALAYKIGELKILALRDEARRALGERFDIRRFHDEVLRHGPLPLSLLEAEVRAALIPKAQ